MTAVKDWVMLPWTDKAQANLSADGLALIGNALDRS